MHLKIVIGLAMASDPEQCTAANTSQHSIQYKTMHVYTDRKL